MEIELFNASEIYFPFVYLLLRVILGVLFFFQAFHKIFRIKLEAVCIEIFQGTREKGIPDWFVAVSVYTTSYLELIGGGLLILGLFTLPVLFVLGLHLLMLFVAFGFLQGIWDMKHIFPRLVLLVTLFLLPHFWDILSLDYLIFR